MTRRRFHTSESVTGGHPDKLADQVSDAILDAALAEDPDARLAIETLVTTGLVIVTGEATTTANLDVTALARETVARAGYDDPDYGFDATSCGVVAILDKQSPDIALGVDTGGAGDQGTVFGYACDETDVLLPLSAHLAHRLAEGLAELRVSGRVPYLRPDGKTQVTVAYDDTTGGRERGAGGSRPGSTGAGDDRGRTYGRGGGGRGRPRVTGILVSAQHDPGISRHDLEAELRAVLIGELVDDGLLAEDWQLTVNPTGRFVIGGPAADTGLTGRKIIVDTYGGVARHGGGAFSGKDATKVDRSGAYAARHAAKAVVASGAASRCEIEIAYSIGVVDPVAIDIETFGTETVDPDRIAEVVLDRFAFSPKAIIDELDLRRPIYLPTATYGHFGRSATAGLFPWEDCAAAADDLTRALGLDPIESITTTGSITTTDPGTAGDRLDPRSGGEPSGLIDPTADRRGEHGGAR